MNPILPTEIFYEIRDSLISKESLDHSIHDLFQFSLTCKTFYFISASKLQELKFLKLKMSIRDYSHIKFDLKKVVGIVIEATTNYLLLENVETQENQVGNMLMNALYCGSHYGIGEKVNPTFFDEKNNEDILKIISYYPECLNFRDKKILFYEYCSPLLLACLNHNISPHLIEELIKRGADPDTPYLNNKSFRSLKEILNILKIANENNNNTERDLLISNLIDRFSKDKNVTSWARNHKLTIHNSNW